VRFLASGGVSHGVRDRQESGGSSQLAVRIAHENADERALADTYSRIVTLAGELGTSVAQRSLFERVHPILAHGRTTVATLATSLDEVEPTIEVEYPEVPWDIALRVVTGLHAEAAEHLGALAGATGAAAAASVWLVLGPGRTPLTGVAVELSSL
jgi:hypothetical protein